VLLILLSKSGFKLPLINTTNVSLLISITLFMILVNNNVYN
jgi:hypothetical protein